MSLTQHLHADGPLSRWMRQHDWSQPVQQVMTLAERTRPGAIRHPSVQGYAEVGGIVGRRVEQRIEAAPPYAALAAAVGRGTVTSLQAGELAQLYPTHSTSAAASALQYRTSPHGWVDIGTAPSGSSSDYGTRAALARAVAQDAAPPPLGAATADVLHAERVLAALEGEYRSGAREERTDRLMRGPLDDQVLTDAQDVERGLRRLPAQLDQLHAAQQASGHAAPCLVPQWADGDLLVGPTTRGGYALLDVKTVGASSLRVRTRLESWLWQVLAYAALDDSDQWMTRAVGLVLPRQDAVIVWPLDELRHGLGIGGEDWTELQQVLAAAYRRDAGNFLHSDVGRVRAGSAASRVR